MKDGLKKATMIDFGGVKIRTKGSMSFVPESQPDVTRNINCQSCKKRFTVTCNFCTIEVTSRSFSCNSNFERINPRSVRFNGVPIRVNGQWFYQAQPMVDYDPFCKVCKDVSTISCNACMWNAEKHSHFRKKGSVTMTKKFEIEEKQLKEETAGLGLHEDYTVVHIKIDGDVMLTGICKKTNIKILEKAFSPNTQVSTEGKLVLDKENVRVMLGTFKNGRRYGFTQTKNSSKEEVDFVLDNFFGMINDIIDQSKDAKKKKEPKENTDLPIQCDFCGEEIESKKDVEEVNYDTYSFQSCGKCYKDQEEHIGRL